MIVLRVIALALCLGSAWWLGAVLAGRALPSATRVSRLALGTGIGLVALGVPMLWLPRVLPAFAALLVSGGLCAFAALPARRGLTTIASRETPRAVAALLGVCVLAYLAALAFWYEGAFGRADVATLYLHSGLVTSIERGNFPVVNPMEPDDLLQYRVTLHTLAAGVTDLLQVPTRDVMPHVIGTIAAVAVATAAGALRRGLTAPWAIGGAAVAFAWGPLYWLTIIPAIRERGLGDVLGVVVESPSSVAWSGLLLGGPYTMGTHNPTAVHGFVVAVVVIGVLSALYPVAITRIEDRSFELRESYMWGTSRGGRLAMWLLATLALTYLGASSEFLVLTVPAGMVVAFWIYRRSVPGHVARGITGLLGATGVAFLLNQTTSGVLGGLIGSQSPLGQLHPNLNTAHFGELPSWGYNSAGPFVRWPMTDWHDVPIVSVELLVDAGPLLWILALTLVWIGMRKGVSHATPWALVAVANVAAVIVFRLDNSTADQYRLLHSGLSFTALAAAIATAEIGTRLPRWKFGWSVVVTTASAVLCGGFLMTSLAWPGMVSQAQQLDREIPLGAADFFRTQTEVSDRVLVVHGARTAYLLYDGETPLITAFIAAETGQFIPYGYHHLSRSEEFSRVYGWAQQRLQDADLESLRIRYVYVEPHEMDQVQRTAIASKLTDGRFREVYREADDTVVIYEFRVDGSNADV